MYYCVQPTMLFDFKTSTGNLKSKTPHFSDFVFDDGKNTTK